LNHELRIREVVGRYLTLQVTADHANDGSVRCYI
jgi:hypothetical protein